MDDAFGLVVKEEDRLIDVCSEGSSNKPAVRQDAKRRGWAVTANSLTGHTEYRQRFFGGPIVSNAEAPQDLALRSFDIACVIEGLCKQAGRRTRPNDCFTRSGREPARATSIRLVHQQQDQTSAPQVTAVGQQKLESVLLKHIKRHCQLKEIRKPTVKWADLAAEL
ncbi:glutaminyl-peptide cyclotransferase [Striga asiatica]|uniref:Glutaminyl-peptide cyclotransferase n=1 Tax=Striga asiatica TaxID=4170 RepID=A0A5A7Q2G2_STRAF|nr:glutaminyl-peptide cyclotransferase [Striga asiatica]